MSYEDFYIDLYPNRTLCSVLEDMRKLDETKCYSSLRSLIEEVQLIANRMEAGLNDQHDFKNLLEKKSGLKKELKKLKDEVNKLREEKDENNRERTDSDV